MNTRTWIILGIVFAIAVALAAIRTQPPKPMLSQEYDLPQSYSSSDKGFSLKLPEGYAVDEAYRYEGLGPGKEIPGVKFTIPQSKAAGTNLSSDTYLSVEQIPNVARCTADLFVWQETPAQTLIDAGVTYSAASTIGAAAGNSYEETIYALPDSDPCTAVRYLIHYGVFENYPSGAVQKFDHKALLNEFDAIRRTLIRGE
jgi:hypothetical protein